ncbi:MAG TPA: hypothetical protein VGM67_13920 [Gemmatimonadaceae bacterium]|jgi:hypothetical protein
MRHFLLAALLLAPSVALAQASPLHTGGWIIDGSAGVSHQRDDDTDVSTTAITLAPSGLYFVTPKLAVGGSALLGYASQFSEWTYGIGPEVRYFIADTSAKLLPFVRASIVPQWERIRSEFNGGETTLTSRLTTATAAAGLTQMVVTHVGVSGEAYFSRQVFHVNRDVGHGDEHVSSYGVRFGLTVFVH